MNRLIKVAPFAWILGITPFAAILAPGTASPLPGANCQVSQDVLPPMRRGAGAFSIVPGISGSWYDPDQSGHGFVLEVLDGNRLSAYWFTYDHAGNQAWAVGTGQIEGNTATVPVLLTEGGVFGPSFDPNAIIREEWGELLFEFDSCSVGRVSYDVGFGSGGISLQRLTTHTGLHCEEGTASATESNSLSGISGSWYDPSQSGHGFVLEAIPGNQLVAYWFTYDQVGNQAWMVGFGPVENNTATVPVLIARGGVFGEDFNPERVTREDWGTLVFTFEACDAGHVGYNVGFGSGSLPLVRLTAHQGLACNIDAQPCADVKGLWHASEMLSFACNIAGETIHDTVSDSAEVIVGQDDCNIHYRAAFDTERNGVINGNRLRLSGPLLAPLFAAGTLTKNIATFEGTVEGNQIELVGSGQAAGSVNGADFTCTANSTASMTRLSETPPEPLYDGVWTGSAVATTATDAFGDPCVGAALRFEVEGTILAGTATADTGERLTVGGHVSSTGTISGGLAFGGDDTASFSGQFSGIRGSGNWEDAWGCRGTWQVSQVSH